MAIKRWNPQDDISTLREHMDRLFKDAFRSCDADNSLYGGTWTPRVDVYETKKELVLTAEIPGLDETNIDIMIEDFTLIIRGKRERQTNIQEENYHRIERSYGSFCRAFSLPDAVDPESISAVYEHGLLTVSLPKTPSRLSQLIPINTGKNDM